MPCLPACQVFSLAAVLLNAFTPNAKKTSQSKGVMPEYKSLIGSRKIVTSLLDLAHVSLTGRDFFYTHILTGRVGNITYFLPLKRVILFWSVQRWGKNMIMRENISPLQSQNIILHTLPGKILHKQNYTLFHEIKDNLNLMFFFFFMSHPAFRIKCMQQRQWKQWVCASACRVAWVRHDAKICSFHHVVNHWKRWTGAKYGNDHSHNRYHVMIFGPITPLYL